jgi:hypothetical protein
MSDRSPSSDAPGIRVEQVRFVTDGVLPTARAQALGTAFAGELDAQVQALRPGAGSLQVRELVVQAAAGALADPAALRQLARSAAQRILDQLPE